MSDLDTPNCGKGTATTARDEPVRIHPLANNRHAVSSSERFRKQGHCGAVVWLTGLSGSGKTTLAMGLERRLFDLGRAAYVLDGDNLRHGLNADLGFSHHDRSENIRRVSEVAALFADAGIICIVALISPYKADRARARAALPEGRFIEVFVSTTLDICEMRDPRGLYLLARSGKLPQFTGIDAPYEAPEGAELVIDAGQRSIAESVDILVGFVSRCTELATPDEAG